MYISVYTRVYILYMCVNGFLMYNFIVVSFITYVAQVTILSIMYVSANVKQYVWLCCLWKVLCKEISYYYWYKVVSPGGCPVKAEKAGPRQMQHSSVVQGFFWQGTFLPGVWAAGQESFWLHAAKILLSSICERDQTDCPAGMCLRFPLCFNNQ